MAIDRAGPERAAAIRTLSAALAQLGDDASRAAQTSHDVRLQVVACQAQHLAGDVWGLLPRSAGWSASSKGLRDLVGVVRESRDSGQRGDRVDGDDGAGNRAPCVREAAHLQDAAPSASQGRHPPSRRPSG